MKDKLTWDKVQMDSEELLDDNLAKNIYIFPEHLSSRGTANGGKPVQNQIHIDKPKGSGRNSVKR